MVHGSSPCGPTTFKAAHCAALSLLRLWHLDQSYGPKVQNRYSAGTPACLWSPFRWPQSLNPPAGTWKAVVRKTGWPTNTKTFRTKRDAEDWARRTEDEMVRGVYIQRSGSERMTLEKALERYLSEVTPSKKPTTRKAEATKAKQLIQRLGKYSMAALSAEVIAKYRDTRLGPLSKSGLPASNNTVRLELALLRHLFTVAIQE